MVGEIFLDNNATTQPLPEVIEAVAGVMGEGFGNPSSAHSLGHRAREYLRLAREAAAQLLNADFDKVFFTSGATESNNLVLSSLLKTGGRFITTGVEHSSVLSVAEQLQGQGVEVVYLPVDRAGLVDVGKLEEELQVPTTLVSIQWVNNETGVIQPIEKIGNLCQDHGARLHTDAAQAAGKIEIGVRNLPIDYLSFTGHKIHAPQGVGVLYAGEPKKFSPLFFGGSQEGGIRPGTENLPGIVGLGKAAELRVERLAATKKHSSALRERFENAIVERLSDVEVNGAVAPRVGNTTNLMFKGLDGQMLVARLDQEGLICSQSSACTNMRPEPPYVLVAMGLSEEEAYSSVRFAFSELNTDEEVGPAVEKIVSLCESLRSFATLS